MYKSLSFGLFVVVLLASGLVAQEQGRYVVSARAGGVNFIRGQVSVTRAAGDRSTLLRQDTIEVGDEVSTGDEAYAEVLLDPGSYLRVAPGSRFRFASTSLDNVKVELLSGSAIFEINSDDNFALSVSTPATTLILNRSGIYRLDLAPPPGELEVIKGRVLIGSTELTSGRRLKLEAGATPEKFDAKHLDAFAAWSDSRAKEIAKIMDAVEAEALNNSLTNSYASNTWGYRSFYSGLWVWDSHYSYGFFLPFSGHHHQWSYGYCRRDPFDWHRHGWEARWRHDKDNKVNVGNTAASRSNGGKDHSHAGRNSNEAKHSHGSPNPNEPKRTGVRQPKPKTGAGGSTGESTSSGGQHRDGGPVSDGSHSSGGSGSHSNGGGASGSHNSGGTGAGGSQHNSSGTAGSHTSTSGSGKSSSSGGSSGHSNSGSKSSEKDH
ncbi:MAG: FecR domain-containing protein [Pyrinomonadaceae bacterium]